MTDLETKVIRCYKKGITASMMQTLGICRYEKAAEILNRYHLQRKHGYFEDGKRIRHTP